MIYITGKNRKNGTNIKIDYDCSLSVKNTIIKHFSDKFDNKTYYIKYNKPYYYVYKKIVEYENFYIIKKKKIKEDIVEIYDEVPFINKLYTTDREMELYLSSIIRNENFIVFKNTVKINKLYMSYHIIEKIVEIIVKLNKKAYINYIIELSVEYTRKTCIYNILETASRYNNIDMIEYMDALGYIHFTDYEWILRNLDLYNIPLYTNKQEI
jgi:hypothetical protein